MPLFGRGREPTVPLLPLTDPMKAILSDYLQTHGNGLAPDNLRYRTAKVPHFLAKTTYGVYLQDNPTNVIVELNEKTDGSLEVYNHPGR